jgi:non-ribosomal peptide synthetase component F
VTIKSCWGANRQTYILDSDLHPVPVGVSGELNIGGPGLARGYFNSPDITAEKFIPNPFSLRGGAAATEQVTVPTSYPTVCRVLGRLDRQVKVRGFRIELGEIETRWSSIHLFGLAPL